MRAGKLRHLLQIQLPTNVRDDIGGVRQEWSTLTTVWGDVEPLRGRELEVAKQIEARISHKITLRYRATVEPKARLRQVTSMDESRAQVKKVFNILAPLNLDERNIELQVYAMEVVHGQA
jgi:SPP1 family predicted phage head-tail adaptor